MNGRLVKQLVIGIVFLFLFGGMGYGIYDVFTPDATCFDNIQNQGEQGVDCGPVCGKLCDPLPIPPQVQSIQVLKVRPGDYDVVASVMNPNTVYGSGKIGYELVLRNAAGAELARLPGTFYIMPAETKFVVRTSLIVSDDVVQADLLVKEAEWQKVSTADVPVDFPLRRESYTEPHQVGVISQLEGVVFNDSDFDFNVVEVAVVLLDNADAIIGVNTTELLTVLSRTERYVKVTWPTPLAGKFAKARVQAGANVFVNENFIRRYGTQEKFQEFYQGR